MPTHLETWTLRFLGSIAGIILLSLPALSDINDPLPQCGLRIICFFYACKVWDVIVAQARQFPVRLVQNPDGSLRPASCNTLGDKISYIYHLAAEMRYHSFDTAVRQKRPSDRNDSFLLRTLLPLVVFPLLAYFVHIPETKIPLVLLLIQHTFEILHRIVHPGCTHKLFYHPFEAPSLTAFWGVHWHSCAAPFLRSLAYEPGKAFIGRWFGVLLAFGLSGLWHGWASAALAEPEFEWTLGLQVGALFVGMGVGCLVEGAMSVGKGGITNLLQRLLTWGIVLWGAGRCWRTVECHGRIEWLRSADCT